jgi:hypothetical protein
MTQIHRIPMMIPLAVGIMTFAGTIFVHVLPLGATVTIVRREKRLGQAGASFWSDFAIVALIILISLVAQNPHFSSLCKCLIPLTQFS